MENFLNYALYTLPYTVQYRWALSCPSPGTVTGEGITPAILTLTTIGTPTGTGNNEEKDKGFPLSHYSKLFKKDKLLTKPKSVFIQSILIDIVISRTNTFSNNKNVGLSSSLELRPSHIMT